MDKLMLTRWKSELETHLSQLEKQIGTLQVERTKVVEQVGSISKLLSSLDININISEMPTEPHTRSQDANEATAEFLSKLKQNGWTVTHRQGRSNIYEVTREGILVEMWIKFSKLHETTGQYWFGISPGSLQSKVNQKGGVILLLGNANHYLCLPFSKLYDLLQGATETETGQKFQIYEDSIKFSILPGGTNNWIDISKYYNNITMIGL